MKKNNKKIVVVVVMNQEAHHKFGNVATHKNVVYKMRKNREELKWRGKMKGKEEKIIDLFVSV